MTLLALGGPLDGVPSSKDAKDSLEASWATLSRAERASKAHSRESEIITIRLF